MSGQKFDQSKVPLDLIPSDAEEEIGKVLLAGEEKYGRANWAKGIELSRLIAAAKRHINQFNKGEDFDDETKTLHLANAAVNLMFAIWMYKNRPDLDDRWEVLLKRDKDKSDAELLEQIKKDIDRENNNFHNVERPVKINLDDLINNINDFNLPEGSEYE